MKTTRKALISLLCVLCIFSTLIDQSVFAASGYGLSAPRTKETVNRYDKKDYITTWDCIFFGSYPQSDPTGAKSEPIRWLVLSVNGNDAFLLSELALDCRKYNSKIKRTSWDQCELREWLNGTFYSSAFTKNEAAAILSTKTYVDSNPYAKVYDEVLGKDTADKVSLLSVNQALNPAYGFYPNENETVHSETRITTSTAYAKTHGATDSQRGTAAWWLHSHGEFTSLNDNAAYVSYYGDMHARGDAYHKEKAIRPCLHLDLSKAVWQSAGTYTCGDGESSQSSQQIKTQPEGKSGSKICYNCSGTGQAIEKCITCNGNGSKMCSRCGGTGQTTCTQCGGSGYVNNFGATSKSRCTRCHGSGSLDCTRCSGGRVTCGDCGGAGKRRTYCSVCGGDGYVD